MKRAGTRHPGGARRHGLGTARRHPLLLEPLPSTRQSRPTRRAGIARRMTFRVTTADHSKAWADPGPSARATTTSSFSETESSHLTFRAGWTGCSMSGWPSPRRRKRPGDTAARPPFRRGSGVHLSRLSRSGRFARVSLTLSRRHAPRRRGAARSASACSVRWPATRRCPGGLARSPTRSRRGSALARIHNRSWVAAARLMCRCPSTCEFRSCRGS